jgi:hypothetical protein
MKTNANSTASLEPSTHAADFAQRVNLNQASIGLMPTAGQYLKWEERTALENPAFYSFVEHSRADRSTGYIE